MFYQNLYMKKQTIIPQSLLELFEFYKTSIMSNLTEPTICDSKVCESSAEYIILNTKKSAKNFNELLFEHIDNANISDVKLYKKADIDKRLFSKIRSSTAYHPSFGTVTLLALALELTSVQYEELLNSASYSLPQNSYVNITLKYCFDNEMYNINEVNDLLYAVSGKVIREL